MHIGNIAKDGCGVDRPVNGYRPGFQSDAKWLTGHRPRRNHSEPKGIEDLPARSDGKACPLVPLDINQTGSPETAAALSSASAFAFFNAS